MSHRTAVVTGAAAGIGRATALRFLAEGYTVGAYDVDGAGLATLATEAAEGRSAGGELLTGRLDVRDAAEFAARLEEAAGHHGRLDVLVNNAGILLSGPFEDHEVVALHREIDINVKGVVNGLHAGFVHLRDTPGATVVNLASASAIYGQAELADYSATKFYVRGLTEALDIEWRRHDIRVVDLWPLFVQTAMTADLRTGSTDSLGIRLTTDDVVAAVWRACRPSPLRRAVHQVHFPVGPRAQAMALGARFAPSWATRLVNRRLAGH